MLLRFELQGWLVRTTKLVGIRVGLVGLSPAEAAHPRALALFHADRWRTLVIR